MTPNQLETQLQLWDGLEKGRATLVNLSENHTFRIDLPDGSKHIIRVHRPGYQTLQSIKSELNWLTALRVDAGIDVVQPMPGQDGALVQTLSNGARDIKTYAVRFAFEHGEIAETLTDLTGLFAQLGKFAALCHTHAAQWKLPGDFERPTWNAQTILDADGLWGDWRTAPHVDGDVAAILQMLDRRLRTDFANYGMQRDRFGLIHADMRLANLLVHNSETRLIDFDDCGFGWFAYDFGAAVSFFEDSPQVPALKQIWLDAYRKYRPFSQEDEDMLDAAILLRRMALLAWIGSHSEVELARHHAPDFAINTAVLAESYLSTR